MGTSLGVADTMALISSKLSNLVPFSCCALFLYNEEMETLRCSFATGIDAEIIQQISVKSGLGLTEEYAEFDAEMRFAVSGYSADEPKECISGLILQGIKKPNECPAFGTRCTPEHPFGATMVSNEGACAAYYRYRRHTAKAA